MAQKHFQIFFALWRFSCLFEQRLVEDRGENGDASVITLLLEDFQLIFDNLQLDGSMVAGYELIENAALCVGDLSRVFLEARGKSEMLFT